MLYMDRVLQNWYEKHPGHLVFESQVHMHVHRLQN